MKNDDSALVAAARLRLSEYLQSKGININKNFRCLAGTHEDKNPSMSYDKDRNKVHCFSCNADMDIFDLVGVEYGLTDFPSQKRKVFELFGLGGQYQKPAKIERTTAAPVSVERQKEKTDYREYFKQCHENASSTDYFSFRGIGENEIKRFYLGYDSKKRAIIIPTSRHSYVERNTDMNAAKNERYKKHGESRPFNLSAIEHNRGGVIFVVEGEIDAISIESLGFPAIALGSATNASKAAAEILKQQKGEAFLIAEDKDESGENATKILEAALSGKSVYFKTVYPFDDCKDANEALMKDREKLKKTLAELVSETGTAAERKQREYREKYGADFLLKAFDAEVMEHTMPAVSTGFKGLDYVFDGGFYEGLYIVGAVSSGGKTTLVTQFMDAIAKGGRDVLYFSLEMSRFELMAKIISRQTGRVALKKSLADKDHGEAIRLYAKSNRDLMRADKVAAFSETERQIVNQAKAVVLSFASHIYIVEGVGTVGIEQIKEMVYKHREITGRAPIVIVDYLQIIAPYEVKASDKQNTDRAVVELKRLSRDLKTPVIAISSFNRNAYGRNADMSSVKESGGIEYGCDVLLALQPVAVRTMKESEFDDQREKRKTPRELEISVLKNRNGRTGDIIPVKYFPHFNLFTEPQDVIETIKANR